MIQPTVPYTAESKAFTMEDTQAKHLIVKIEPQVHEIQVTPETLWKARQESGLSPERAMQTAMIEMLRDQAISAYVTVLASGLTALAGKPVTREEVDSVIALEIERAYKMLERAEGERDDWKELATRRAVEVNALERAIARRGE